LFGWARQQAHERTLAMQERVLLDFAAAKARHEAKRKKLIPKTDVRARVYLPPAGTIARSLVYQDARTR
jgi:hypothetical protein